MQFTRAIILWVPWMVSPEVKRPGLQPDNSPSSSIKIKNECSYTYISASVFVACAGTNLPLRWPTLLRIRQDMASVLKP